MGKIKMFEEENKTYVNNETQADKKNFKERLEDFGDKRMVSGRITENSARSTFHISKDILEKLENLVNHIEATTSLESKLHEDMTVREVRDMRIYAKGFKSKFVGFALAQAMDEYEADMGVIPETERVRYKVADGTYHRSFLFKENNILYLLTQNNRGYEVECYTSEETPENEIRAKFESYVERAKSQSKK